MGLAHQRGVAGRGLVPAGRHADERLGDLAAAQPHGVVVGPVRRARGPLGRMAAGKFGLVPAAVGLAVHIRRLLAIGPSLGGDRGLGKGAAHAENAF